MSISPTVKIPLIAPTQWRRSSGRIRYLARRLNPAGHDDLLLGVELDGIAAVSVQIAEERLLPAGKREERHWGGDTYIDAHHAGFDARGVIAGGLAVGSEDGRRVAER